MYNENVQFQMEIRKISRRRSRSSDYAELGHFTLLFLQRTAKKCAKIYNARAEPLFTSLSLCLVTFSLPSSSLNPIKGKDTPR